MASLPAANENEAGYFDPLPEQPRSASEDQWTWIEAQLVASKAQYILVGGHYPVRLLEGNL